jgi:hypothetical protein
MCEPKEVSRKQEAGDLFPPVESQLEYFHGTARNVEKVLRRAAFEENGLPPLRFDRPRDR